MGSKLETSSTSCLPCNFEETAIDLYSSAILAPLFMWVLITGFVCSEDLYLCKKNLDLKICSSLLSAFFRLLLSLF